MENTIEITDIQAKENCIYYTLRESGSLNLLKSKNVNAWIKFDHIDDFGADIASLPRSVLAIPMSLYLIPTTYYYDVNVVLPVMDKELHDTLPAIRSAYERIYGAPENTRGGVRVYSIEENNLPVRDDFEKIVFFSGGVDACSAGVNNAGAKSVLVSIPSIESQAKNEGALREEKYRLIQDFSRVSGSPWVLISNNFNDDVFNDNAIQAHLKTFLSSEAFNFDGWFGIKYLANMSSVAPLAYALGAKSLVMGSAFEQLEEKKSVNQDGANPELSDSIRYAGIRFAEQDEIYTRRQKKTANVIKWCNERGAKVKLWTCFSDRAEQCGVCAKCVRTQLNILTTGENPKDWGFALFDEKKFSHFVHSYRYWERNACWLWDNVDAIDDGKTYPYCDEMLHWLKSKGYAEYLKKARNMLRLRNMCKRLLKVYKYPYYAGRVAEKLWSKK